MLMLARTGGWMLTTPLFGHSGAATVGRSAMSIALSLALAGTIPATSLPSELGAFLVELIVQFLLGVGFGWLTGLILQAPAIAGSFSDTLSGLGYAAVVDPTNGQQASVFSRMFSMTFLAILFATTGYQSIILGFGTSVQAFGVGARPTLSADAAGVLATAVTGMMRAALEVGGPLLGALLLTDATLGMAARFFPQANITFVGLSLKVLIALFLVGVVLTLLPSRVDGLINFGETLTQQVLSTSSGR